MKALSIRQPWAWLVCAGIKDVENRTWPTPVRGRVQVHASLSKASLDKFTLAAILRIASNKEAAPLMGEWDRLTRGAIIGEVDIIGCRRRVGTLGDGDVSKWHEVGQYGFYFENAVMYETPLPCKGRLGFFEPSFERFNA